MLVSDLLSLQQETVREEEEEVPRIDVEIPRCVAQLGSEPNFIKLPNFLSIETRQSNPCFFLQSRHRMSVFLSFFRPFDEAVYEDEAEDDGEILDEDGRARLKLKVHYASSPKEHFFDSNITRTILFLKTW